MMCKWQIPFRAVSLGLALLLATIWGLRWNHAFHGHHEPHSHHHHAQSHDSEGHDHDDCELCKWALAFFEIEESFTWQWIASAEQVEPSFCYANPVVICEHTANCLRGPPYHA